MDLHKLLARQLKRYEIDMDSPVLNVEQWKKFIESVNNAYIQTDRERYLTERSMRLSSKEFSELNKKLENAQEIAGLGYWLYNVTTGEVVWSNTLYRLLGLQPGKTSINIEKALQMVHEEDRPGLMKLIERFTQEHQGYITDIRMLVKSEYRWFHVVANASQDSKEILTGVVMDITERLEAEEKIKELQFQAMGLARQAGMADVATSILHNVGNVLNSVNVSARIIEETISQGHEKKLLLVIKMMEEHSSMLDEFLTKDIKGKLIPKYIISLGGFLDQDYQKISKELADLLEHIQHVKDIVVMQQSISGVSGFNEKVFIPEMVDIALRMSGLADRKNIQINKKYEDKLFLFIDKSKLLQILVNLMTNAKDAVNECNSINKNIDIEITNKGKDDKFQIIVKDNGVGIPKENLVKIFSFGYTTKKHGHGYGLHSSALAANEIGGELIAVSEGVDQGASFILKLPVRNNTN